MKPLIIMGLVMIMLSMTATAQYQDQVDNMLNSSYIKATASMYNVATVGYLGIMLLFFTMITALIVSKSPEVTAIIALLGSGFLAYLQANFADVPYWSIEMQGVTYLVGILGLAYLIWKLIIE